MELTVNHRDNFSRVQLKEPKQNAFTENAYEPEEAEISDSKMPIKDIYKKWSPLIYFIIGMLVMWAIASYWYGNKYENLMNAIERREELLWKMEYNNSVIRGKVEENATIRNQVLSDNEMMVEAIKTANGVKEQKIVEN